MRFIPVLVVFLMLVVLILMSIVYRKLNQIGRILQERIEHYRHLEKLIDIQADRIYALEKKWEMNDAIHPLGPW